MRHSKANAHILTRAWILLKFADGWDEAKIAETFAISQATIKNVAHRFAEGGLDLAWPETPTAKHCQSSAQTSPRLGAHPRLR